MVASVLAALAGGAAALISARLLQGVGGALILPSTLSTVNATFRGKERAAAFRADPEVQEALEAAKVTELAQPTLAEGEDAAALMADRSAFEDFDADAYFDGKGFGFVRLQQLATEHLLGAR